MGTNLIYPSTHTLVNSFPLTHRPLHLYTHSSYTHSLITLTKGGAMENPIFDLLLKGGHVIDPANGLDGLADVGIAAGKVARVAAPGRRARSLPRKPDRSSMSAGALSRRGSSTSTPTSTPSAPGVRIISRRCTLTRTCSPRGSPRLSMWARRGGSISRISKSM